MGRETAAPPAAGRHDHEHGDDDWPTPADEARIERRAQELLTERLYGDPAQFDDLMAGIEPCDYLPQVQRMIANLRAPNFERIGVDAITTSLYQIDRIVRAEAGRVWLDELRTLAALADRHDLSPHLTRDAIDHLFPSLNSQCARNL